MGEMVLVHEHVQNILDEMRDEHITEYKEQLSYSNAIKQIMVEAGRWQEPTVKKKKLKKKSKKHTHDNEE